MEFNSLTFTDNLVGKWTGSFTAGTVSIDGREVMDNELSAMFREQLSSSGIRAVEADYLTIERDGTKEVYVKTADEFTAAIASDTTVYIDVPQIDLTACTDLGVSKRVIVFDCLGRFPCII